MTRDEFIARYGAIYEDSPWVAEAVWEAGDLDGVAGAMRAAVDTAPEAARMELVRAHPDLAGKAALAGALTADSTAEQASAGLDRCSPEELAEFHALNSAYRRKFGFPFIVAVKGLTRHDILEQFRHRLENDATTELATAFEQIHTIARLRLEALEP
ncbi:MAG: 2-oxo-4-hydroxy-4-carboxy-5-ureidoimidazoline decarboxylase [Sphingomonadales bacterium]|nr:2-oxo-4-hydroxy-4-carboxy-5-ureidoimidazoline decarboxylase [Sphingomonadales bacterium]